MSKLEALPVTGCRAHGWDAVLGSDEYPGCSECEDLVGPVEVTFEVRTTYRGSVDRLTVTMHDAGEYGDQQVGELGEWLVDALRGGYGQDARVVTTLKSVFRRKRQAVPEL